MIPAGFMAKHISIAPAWLKTDALTDIYSVSNCISTAFCDYIKHWRHNGFWFFDSAEAVRGVAAAEAVDLSVHKLFYYEVYEAQFDGERNLWEAFTPETSLRTHVAMPWQKQLEGYDVVTFSARTSPECSPLSCNGRARILPVNRHCLFASFEQARDQLERGAFDQCEPGPYRIFAVFSCAAP